MERKAMIRFSDSKSCKIISPELSSGEQPGIKMGRISIRTIIEEIERPGKDLFSKTIVSNTILKIRASSLG